jgi:hypothetical protein
MKIFLSILLTSLCLLTFAQEYKSEIRFGVNCDFNVESLSSDDLNSYLINKGYYSSSNILETTSLGFSIRALDNHSIIKVNFYSGESLMENAEDKSVFYSTGFGFDYLYNLIKPETWFVGPYIGVRLSNYKLTAVSKDSISALTTKYVEESIQFNNNPLVLLYEPNFIGCSNFCLL